MPKKLRARLSPDGRTFYVGSAGGNTLDAIDVSNPSLPVTRWVGNYDSHGLEISNDDKRAYVAGIDSGLIILDTSEIQKRSSRGCARLPVCSGSR